MYSRTNIFLKFSLSTILLLLFVVLPSASAHADTYNLTLDNKNLGIIMVSPELVEYEHGQEVTITAAANYGYRFNFWSGDLTSNSNPMTFIMDSDKSITSVFSPQDEVSSTPSQPLSSEMPQGDRPIVYFLGDSLTDYFDGGWQTAFANYKILNIGRGGYSADQIYDYILLGGNIHFSNVNRIFIMAGINDLFKDKTSDKAASLVYTINDFQNIIDRIKEYGESDTTIYIQSVLPVSSDLESECNNEYIEELNLSLSQLASSNSAVFINLYDFFYDPTNGNNYTIDGVHLTSEGYNIWLEALAPYLPDPTSDSDDDLLPDSWEISNFGTLEYASEDDPDNDGYTNLQEYIAGSDPNIATLKPPMNVRILKD